MTGYTINPRGTWDDDAFADERFTEREAWLWLREQANYADKPYRPKRSNQIYTIKRGELPCTILGLSERFKWSREKTRNFLGILESTNKIRQRADTKITIITICDYCKFDGEPTMNRHQSFQRTDNEPTMNRHTYNKETKETKETKDDDVSAHAEKSFSEICETIQREINSPVPMNLGRVKTLIEEGCDPELDILATIREVMAKLRERCQPPPSSFRYFEQSIANAKATRLAPIMTGQARASPDSQNPNAFADQYIAERKKRREQEARKDGIN